MVDIRTIRGKNQKDAITKATVEYGSNFTILSNKEERVKGPLGLFKKPDYVLRIMLRDSIYDRYENRRSESVNILREDNNDNYEDKLISDGKELNKHRYAAETTETIDGSEMGERIVNMINALKAAKSMAKSNNTQNENNLNSSSDIQINNLNLNSNENILKEKTINEKFIDKKEERIENFENNRMRNNNFTPLSSFNNSYNPSMFGGSMLSDYNSNNHIDNIDRIEETERKSYHDKENFDNNEVADSMEESFNYLRNREFPEEILINLREYLLNSSDARFFQSREIIKDEIEKYFSNKLILSDGIDIGAKKKIIIFVGPTGVGKTTTIPKIAAQYIRSGRKVSFVTIDNYRIAAVDQLQRYASILKVPFTSASNPEALRAEIRKMDSSSLLFVDTMGRSPKGTDEIISMSKYFSTVGRFDMDVQLVMSSTAKYKDSLKILNAFKPANYKGIILTKVDETDYLASSVCAISGTKTPITYVTCGQGVPKDISTAKKYGKNIIENLYGNLK